MHGSMRMVVVGLGLALTTTHTLGEERLPVAASRPSKIAWSARTVIDESGRIIRATFRGQQAGMFDRRHSADVNQRELKKIRDSRDVTRFLRGKTFSNRELVERLSLWMLRRPPKAAEMQTVLRHVAAQPDRATALNDLIWAYVNSKEFLLRPAK